MQGFVILKDKISKKIKLLINLFQKIIRFKFLIIYWWIYFQFFITYIKSMDEVSQTADKLIWEIANRNISLAAQWHKNFNFILK